MRATALRRWFSAGRAASRPAPVWTDRPVMLAKLVERFDHHGPVAVNREPGAHVAEARFSIA